MVAGADSSANPVPSSEFVGYPHAERDPISPLGERGTPFGVEFITNRNQIVTLRNRIADAAPPGCVLSASEAPQGDV